jgi:hypothetical protein
MGYTEKHQKKRRSEFWRSAGRVHTGHRTRAAAVQGSTQNGMRSKHLSNTHRERDTDTHTDTHTHTQHTHPLTNSQARERAVGRGLEHKQVVPGIRYDTGYADF